MKTNEKAPPLETGRYFSYLFHRTPRRILYTLSYYKFAARMIGSNKRVLDIGCNEGLGAFLIAKECGYAYGIDLDSEAILAAKRNFSESFVDFSEEDFLHSKISDIYDAVINFDVIEHILPKHADHFIFRMYQIIKEEGLAVIGTPSEISQAYASEVSKKGHVNIYSPQRFEESLRKYFHQVFLFSVHDEIIHTGFKPLAHYLIAVCCEKRKEPLMPLL